VSDDVFPGSLSYRLVEETGISVPRGAGVGARVFGSEHEAQGAGRWLLEREESEKEWGQGP